MFLFFFVFLINLICTPFKFLKKYYQSLHDREYEYVSSSEEEAPLEDNDNKSNTDSDQEHLKDD